MTRPLRTYQPAWIQLKSDPTNPLKIVAEPRLHKRIYKAVIKEKWMDEVFHLECSFKRVTTKLSSSSTGNILTINLHIIPDTDAMFD